MEGTNQFPNSHKEKNHCRVIKDKEPGLSINEDYI